MNRKYCPCLASCTALQYPTSLSFSALSTKAAGRILSTHTDAVTANFQEAVETAERTDREALYATLNAIQTILLKTRQMQQTLMADFLDTQTSIISRIDNGLAAIIGLAKKDIREPLSSALLIAGDMYNMLAKSNIDIISRALARE